MSNYHNTSNNEFSPGLQGSIVRGILGSIAGMIVCILVMLLCSLCQKGSFRIMLQLFVGLVIGWFYRLFRGRRSKTAAYVTVGICTLLSSALWVVLLILLPVILSPTPLAATDWGRLWSMIWELLLLCVGLGMLGFSLPEEAFWLMQTGIEAPGIPRMQGGMGILITCSRKNSPQLTHRCTLLYIAVLRRGYRS